MGSSQTRARTRVPCIGKRILNHCATTTAMRSLCTTTKSSPCSPQLENAHVQQQRLNAAKKKKKKRFIHVIAHVVSSFLFKVKNVPFYIYTTFCLSILLPLDNWVSSTSWLLCSYESGVLLSLRNPPLNSFGYVPRSETSGPHCNSIFNFLRNHHAILMAAASFLTLLISC